MTNGHLRPPRFSTTLTDVTAKRSLSAALSAAGTGSSGDQHRQELGFQSMKTAYATIKGFEVMRMFRKGQFAPWIDAICGGTEARFIHRLFGLYAWATAQAFT
jgi:hypothetical protein